MSEPRTRYYHISSSKLFRPFLKSVVFALGIHWFFQCILHMDRTERYFKIAVDIIFSILFFVFFIRLFSWKVAILFGWVFAHTINLLLNGQINVVLKHYGIIKHRQDEFDLYTKSLSDRIQNEPSIRWAAIYGSMSRGEMEDTSDLDLRLIRYPGFTNGLRACLFVSRERTRALLERFPLDLLLLDSPRLLDKLRTDEPPIVVFSSER